MSNAIAGWVGKVYVSIDGGSNYFELGEMRNFNKRQHVDMFDATSHASSGNRRVKPGIASWDADIEALYVSADVAQDNLDTALSGKTLCKFRFDPEGTSSGKERWSGDGYIEDAEVQGPTTDLVLRNVKIAGDGVLTKSTQ